MEHILQQHFSRVVTKEAIQRVNVRRSDLLQDAIRQFSRSSFDVSKLLKVCFIGESAVDDGGPRREFFRLLLQELFSASGLFDGYPESTSPQHNVVAIAQSQFSMAGKVIAASIVQGGPAPACFSPAAADMLVYNEVLSNVRLSDIVDAEVQMQMQRVCLQFNVNVYSLHIHMYIIEPPPFTRLAMQPPLMTFRVFYIQMISIGRIATEVCTAVCE